MAFPYTPKRTISAFTNIGAQSISFLTISNPMKARSTPIYVHVSFLFTKVRETVTYDEPDCQCVDEDSASEYNSEYEEPRMTLPDCVQALTPIVSIKSDQKSTKPVILQIPMEKPEDSAIG